jgi:hypothetical protein
MNKTRKHANHRAGRPAALAATLLIALSAASLAACNARSGLGATAGAATHAAAATDAAAGMRTFDRVDADPSDDRPAVTGAQDLLVRGPGGAVETW